ncbi:MAG TPA: diphosphomevalonate decarboxylase [Bacilli bacterium]
MKATARAHTNIALVKYWGKRDDALVLPCNNSISLTLDAFYTTTSVEFCDHLNDDVILLNGLIVDEREQHKISRFLDIVRSAAGTSVHAVVKSVNHVPTAAGFASSASGFAALAAAAMKALDLPLDEQAMSLMARRGSGSACRSVYGGFVEWLKGERKDGSDSYAVPLAAQDYWDLRVMAVTLSAGVKEVSSREGMKRTVDTSPFYNGWLQSVEHDLRNVRQAIAERDFAMLGRTAEANALKMHASMFAANPPIIYWHSATVDVIRRVKELRTAGIPAYFTIDAGPNVKVLCEPKDEIAVRSALLSVPDVLAVTVCRPGPGVTFLQGA